MSAEEDQSQYEDGLAGGPGAPTPLSALDVCLEGPNIPETTLIVSTGSRRSYKTRHTAIRRRRVQHCRVGGIHTQEDTRANQRHFGTESDKDINRR